MMNMQTKELISLIDNIISLRIKTKSIAFKEMEDGEPEIVYNTFSSFSNT